MYIGLQEKYPLFLSDFNERFSKNKWTLNSMMIWPVGAELFHADGQTYMAKVKVAPRNFAKTPNTYNFPLVHNTTKFGFLLYTT